MAPRAYPRKGMLYGVARGVFRRAVFAQTFSIFDALFKPTKRQGEEWSKLINKAFTKFLQNARAALSSFGGLQATTYSLILRYSNELTGRLDKLWEDYQAGYKPPETTRKELESTVAGWGDGDVYRDALESESIARDSKPVRARPIGLVLRAISPEGNGEELPDGAWRAKLEIAAELAAPKRKAKRAPRKGSTADVRAAFDENRSITNAQAYAKFPSVPKPSIRRILNEARNATKKR